MSVLCLNVIGLVLTMNRFVRTSIVIVLNVTECVLNMTGLVLNMSKFFQNIVIFVQNMIKYLCLS